LKAAWDYLRFKDSGKINKWYETLFAYGEESAVIPAYIRIFHSIVKNNDDNWVLKPDHEERCVRFLRNWARFAFAKGFYSKAGEKSLENEMYRAIIAASHNEEYNPTVDIDDDFIKLLDAPLPRHKLRSAFCRILELENAGSDEWINLEEKGKDGSTQGKKHDFSGQVEHILPQKWDNNYYDEWDAKVAEEVKQKVGNLVFLEKGQNIKGSNEFFNRKKDVAYSKSRFAQVQELCDVQKYPNWTFAIYEKRHEECKERLIRFFKGE
jgi:hypothetical protein